VCIHTLPPDSLHASATLPHRAVGFRFGVFFFAAMFRGCVCLRFSKVMGSGPSAEWNHEEALLKDMPNPPRSMEWKEEEKKGDEAAAAAKPANRSFPRRTQGSAGLSKTPFEKEGPMPSIWHAFLYVGVGI
jgi:hypothetical protein